jgi:hypothetical protein
VPDGLVLIRQPDLPTTLAIADGIERRGQRDAR